jgi:hypothetical protein
VRAELAGADQLGVVLGRDDHARTGGAGELQREDRHAAGALQEDDVAGTHRLERVPRGERSDRQRRRLLEREVIGHAHGALGVEEGVLGEDAGARRAERRAAGLRGRRAGDPALRVDADHTVAGRDAGDAGADRDDLTGAVGQRHERQRLIRRVDAARDHEVAVVERGGPDPDEHLAGAGLGARALREDEVIEAERLIEDPCLHAGTMHPCARGE